MRRAEHDKGWMVSCDEWNVVPRLQYEPTQVRDSAFLAAQAGQFSERNSPQGQNAPRLALSDHGVQIRLAMVYCFAFIRSAVEPVLWWSASDYVSQGEL